MPAATERGEVLAQQAQQLVGAPFRAICRDCELPSHMRVNGVGALNRPGGVPRRRWRETVRPSDALAGVDLESLSERELERLFVCGLGAGRIAGRNRARCAA